MTDTCPKCKGEIVNNLGSHITARGVLDPLSSMQYCEEKQVKQLQEKITEISSERNCKVANLRSCISELEASNSALGAEKKQWIEACESCSWKTDVQVLIRKIFAFEQDQLDVCKRLGGLIEDGKPVSRLDGDGGLAAAVMRENKRLQTRMPKLEIELAKRLNSIIVLTKKTKKLQTKNDEQYNEIKEYQAAASLLGDELSPDGLAREIVKLQAANSALGAENGGLKELCDTYCDDCESANEVAQFRAENEQLETKSNELEESESAARDAAHTFDLEISRLQAEVSALGTIVDKLPILVRNICERRELIQCWFEENPDDGPGDCGNWPGCLPDCPLKQLRGIVGIVPQEDGGMDKQPTKDETSPRDGTSHKGAPEAAGAMGGTSHKGEALNTVAGSREKK